MLQVSILSGKTAGTEWVARRFPVVIGRAANCDLQLEEDGVWDQHLHLHFDKAEGFILETAPHALATLNGQTLQRIVLRNGDVVELGLSEGAIFPEQNYSIWTSFPGSFDLDSNWRNFAGANRPDLLVDWLIGKAAATN